MIMKSLILERGVTMAKSWLFTSFWGFFKPENNTEKAEYDCAHLKFRFRHLFNVASGLSAEVPYPFNMDYPAFAWKSKEEDTPEDAQFHKEFMQSFRLSVNFSIQPPIIIPHNESEVPVKLKSKPPMKKSQKYKLMVKNSRRLTAGNLVEGYTKMLKDGAIFQPFTNTYKPTIIVSST